MEIQTCEMHTGGGPVRIIESGFPDIPGKTMIDKRKFLKKNLDHLRKLIMWEPRGHWDMFGALLVPVCNPKADLGAIFMDNEGHATMCGHAIISLGRYAVDKGLVKRTEPETKVTIECPCGPVECYTEVSEGRSGHTRFHSVPAFVLATDVEVHVEGFGNLQVDICYGGVFYAFMSAEQAGLDVKKSKTRDLIDFAQELADSVKEQVPLHHPESSDLAFLHGVILTDGNDKFSQEPTANLCFFADKQIDRAPCGSGVTARIALQFLKGCITFGQTRQFESITNDIFTGKVVKETTCGEFSAVVVEVRGKGWYTGKCTFTHEDGDELGNGFMVSS